jgi:hypothetical protein
MITTHYIAKVGEMYVRDVYIHSGAVHLNVSEREAMKLTKEEAHFCKLHLDAKIKGVKVEVTHFDEEDFQ